METQRTLTNGGQNVFYQTEPNKISINLRSGEVRTQYVRQGWINLTPDFELQFGGEYPLPLTEEEARRVANELGLRFEIDDPRKRVYPIRNDKGELVKNLDALLAMAGYGPEAESWERTNGCVFLITSGRRNPVSDPFLEDEVRLEAHNIIKKARQWIHQNFRALKRHVKLDEFQAVQFWVRASHNKCEIIRVKPGDSVEVTKSGKSHFGSGGAWGTWLVFGEITEEVIQSKDNGFVVTDKVKVTFNGPAAVYTAAGDSINGGRTFYRQLYVAE